jgi:hypothetical protein
VAELDAAARRRSGRCGGPQAAFGHESRDHGSGVLIGSLMAAKLIDEYQAVAQRAMRFGGS